MTAESSLLSTRLGLYNIRLVEAIDDDISMPYIVLMCKRDSDDHWDQSDDELEWPPRVPVGPGATGLAVGSSYLDSGSFVVFGVAESASGLVVEGRDMSLSVTGYFALSFPGGAARIRFPGSDWMVSFMPNAEFMSRGKVTPWRRV